MKIKINKLNNTQYEFNYNGAVYIINKCTVSFVESWTIRNDIGQTVGEGETEYFALEDFKNSIK